MAGPTGVEVAGMLGEMKKHPIGKEYPELRNSSVNIHVIEGSPNLLSAMSDTTHRAAIAALKQLGVHVKLNTLVTSFKDEQALLSDGSVIHAKTLLWTAGVVARAFEGIDAQEPGQRQENDHRRLQPRAGLP